MLEGLLAGLTHAETNGIVHRDLKPENLMVTADGRIKIADFGIAKATTKMQTGAFLTATGTTVGTPTYMAPEQAMAQDIGPWTDLYSVGCMAFELFTGNVPFHDSESPMAMLLRHVNEPIPRADTDQRRRRSADRRLDRAAARQGARAPDPQNADAGVGRARGDPARATRPALAALGEPRRRTPRARPADVHAAPLGRRALAAGAGRRAADADPLEAIPSPPADDSGFVTFDEAAPARPSRSRRG